MGYLWHGVGEGINLVIMSGDTIAGDWHCWCGKHLEFVEASDTTKVDSSQDTDYNWKSLGKLQSSLCRPMFYSSSPPPP